MPIPSITAEMILIPGPIPATEMERTETAPNYSETAVLSASLARGDEAAFREFHARYFDRLLRYQIVLARGDEQAAREALQETFTRVARRAKRFETEEAFWSWLTVLARSAAVDCGRRRLRYWAMLKSYAANLFSPGTNAAAASEIDLSQLLTEGLSALPPADRWLLEEKYFQEKSIRELATSLSQTEKAVESRLLRLRRELRYYIETRLRHENS